MQYFVFVDVPFDLIIINTKVEFVDIFYVLILYTDSYFVTL
jgi:hypothetical protein